MKPLFNPRTGEFTEFQDTLFCSAFAETGLDATGSGSKGVGSMGVYQSTADTLATILANAYLDGYATTLKDGQPLFVRGSDGYGIYEVSVTGTSDVALAPVGGGHRLETIASTGSTGTALNADGISLFNSTFAGTYALPVPIPGSGPKIIIMGTTSAIVVASTVDITAGGLTQITYAAKDQVSILLPINSSRWQLVANGTAISTDAAAPVVA